MVRRNIAANAAARAWGVVSVYLFVPLYLKCLGVEAYGLVGLYSTLLAVLAFADMGLTATLNREMARLSLGGGNTPEMRDVVRTYECIYLCVCSLLAVMIWFSAQAIAERWLNSKVLKPGEIAAAIRLMGIGIALQLPASLYAGGLMGLQRQISANSIQVAWSAFRGLGTVLVLVFVSPTVYAFASCQVISNAAYCLGVRYSLLKNIASADRSYPHFRWHVLINTWRYAAGVAGMGLLSTAISQGDKVMVSKLLPLEMLGYYTLAWSVASVPLMLAGPIGSAVFPRLTGLVALGDRHGLTRLYHRTCELVGVAIIPAGLTCVFFAENLIWVWTGSHEVAERCGPVASFLIAGQLMQATTLVPYYLALAHGDLKLNIQIGAASIVLGLPTLALLLRTNGIVGGGLSWFVVSACTIPLYMYFLHRKFLPAEFQRWCIRAIGLPTAGAAPCILLGRCLAPDASSRLFMLGLIGAVWFAATMAGALTSEECRSEWQRRILRRATAFPLVNGPQP